MDITIHPEAAKALDAVANSISLKATVATDRAPGTAQRPWGEKYISARFTDSDIIGPIRAYLVDNLGNRGGIRTHVESNEFEVTGENFQALVALADRVLNISTFKRLLSREYIEDLIFDWSILRYQDAATASFPDYLTACVERDASEHNIWMPIANLQVQEDFQFGPAGIVTIPRSLFDTSEEQWLAMGPEKASAIRAHADKLRRELQGNAAVAIAVRGEKIYARSQARSIAEDVVGLLRFFHAAAVTSSIHCPTELLGQEADPVVTTLVFDETGRFD